MPYSTYYPERKKSVSIFCSASNADTIEWRKTHGTQYDSIPSSTTKYYVGNLPNPNLTIKNVSVSDDGEYRCCGANNYGTLCGSTTVKSGCKYYI